MIPNEVLVELREAIEEIRAAGQEVHHQTIINNLESILVAKKLEILKEKVKIDKHWARRWAISQGYVQRKGTQSKVIKEFTEETRKEFLMKIALTVQDNSISQELVVIFDETSANLCPTTNSTLNVRGEKQVKIANFDDKRQYTLGLGLLLLLILLI